ncbi:hypothetical protein GCM10023194_61320 [Planotetraspora phitsanulokensis]|uniref:Uncharacterized protein n=1 Tax=Planotetraspora phitsanulokensis TaxID=575192 RepID=A0A8J3U612_9ACTN|nr:hypothetical protein [Planotetraspora phitsanulokensis]GII37647.1 hypothetical protein Pph01_26500 [Planotetraspora phitsanulokensis]
MATYGASTRAASASVTTLSTRISREPATRARISPATGTLTKATAAAYRWIPPDIDRDNPGLSVGNPATSSRQQLHSPVSSATPRSSRASRRATSAEPHASDTSETGSSQPYGAKTNWLITSCRGSSPDTRCRSTMPRQPAPISAWAATRVRSAGRSADTRSLPRRATSYGFPAKVKDIPMANHSGRGEDAGPSEIHRTGP